MAIEAWDMSAEGKYLLDAALRLSERDREILADRLHASVENIESTKHGSKPGPPSSISAMRNSTAGKSSR